MNAARLASEVLDMRRENRRLAEVASEVSRLRKEREQSIQLLNELYVLSRDCGVSIPQNMRGPIQSLLKRCSDVPMRA